MVDSSVSIVYTIPDLAREEILPLPHEPVVYFNLPEEDIVTGECDTCLKYEF